MHRRLMTTRFSWEMDFGDDDFATAADVSLDVQNYRLRIALDTEQDEAEFVDIAAEWAAGADEQVS